MRVREEPLQLTRPGDIAVPLLVDPFTAASVVLDHLMSLMAWPTETHERARAYIAGGRRLGAELAERLIAELRPATGPTAPPPTALRSGDRPGRSSKAGR